MWYNKFMIKKSLFYPAVSLASVLVSFFLIGSASAYTAKINIQSGGNGTGQVTLSATSSNYFPFTGWAGETCIGAGPCELKNLSPQTSKTVFVSFGQPTCSDFIYSAFGACQLDGYQYSNFVAAIGPPGCTSDQSPAPVIRQPCVSVTASACGSAYGQNLTTAPDLSGSQQGIIDQWISGIVDFFTGGAQTQTGTEPGVSTGASPAPVTNVGVNSAGGSRGYIDPASGAFVPPGATPPSAASVGGGIVDLGSGAYYTDPKTGDIYYGSHPTAPITGGGVDAGTSYDVITTSGTVVKIGTLPSTLPPAPAPAPATQGTSAASAPLLELRYPVEPDIIVTAPRYVPPSNPPTPPATDDYFSNPFAPSPITYNPCRQ